MQSHPVFRTDTAAMFGDLLKNKGIFEVRILIQDYIHMQIAITDMPIAEDQSPGLFPQMLQKGGPLPDIKRYIVGEDPSLLPDRCHSHVLPDLPNFAIFLIAIGDDGVVEVLERLEERVQVLGGRLNEQHVLLRLNFVENWRMQVPDNRVIRMPIDVLQCSQVFAQAFLYYRQALQNLLEPVCLKHHYLPNLIDFFTQNIQFGDDSYRSLPPYEQLLQVEASIILMNLRPEVQNISVGRHGLEPQDMRAQGAIFNHVFSTSIGGDIAANEAGPLGAQIQGSLEAVGLKVLIQLVKNNSRLAVDDRCHLVEALYLVHVFHIHDDLVENRHTPTHETRIAALRNHCQLTTIAIGQYPRHVVCSARTKHQF